MNDFEHIMSVASSSVEVPIISNAKDVPSLSEVDNNLVSLSTIRGGSCMGSIGRFAEPPTTLRSVHNAKLSSVIPTTISNMSVRRSTDVDNLLKSRRITIVDSVTAARLHEQDTRKLVHPKFEVMSSMTKDPYWIDIYKNAALGIYHHGFFYDGYRLTFIDRTRSKRKTVEVILEDDPEQAFATSLDFFRNIGGLMSEIDRKRAKRHREEISHAESNKVNLKRSGVKRELLRSFVNRISKEKGLTKTQKIEMNKVISRGFLMNRITTSDIILKGHNIVWINNLNYDENTKTFSIPQKTKKILTAKKSHDYSHLHPNNKLKFIKTKPDIRKRWDNWKKNANKMLIVSTPTKAETLSLQLHVVDEDDDDEQTIPLTNDTFAVARTSIGNSIKYEPTVSAIGTTFNINTTEHSNDNINDSSFNVAVTGLGEPITVI